MKNLNTNVKTTANECKDINEATATAQALGLTVENKTWCYAFFYLKDENGEHIKNRNGEYIVISASLCINPGGRNSLPYLWHKNGHTAKELHSYWSIDTYVHQDDGSCVRGYDPTIKKSEFGKRFQLDFDWVLPATAENLGKILSEIIRQFRAAGELIAK